MMNSIPIILTHSLLIQAFEIVTEQEWYTEYAHMEKKNCECVH